MILIANSSAMKRSNNAKMAIKINSNNNITEISINENKIKNIQHAYDLTTALNDEISIQHALDTIHMFCEHADK